MKEAALRKKKRMEAKAAAEKASIMVPMSAYTSGECSGSFTSTAMTPVTKNRVRPMTEDEIREQRYKEVQRRGSQKRGGRRKTCVL